MKGARADIRLELQKGLKARNLGLPDVDIRKFRLNYNTVLYFHEKHAKNYVLLLPESFFKVGLQ